MIHIHRLLEIVEFFGKVPQSVVPPIRVLHQVSDCLIVVGPQSSGVIAPHAEVIHFGLQLDDLLLELLMCVGIGLLQQFQFRCFELELLRK